MSVSISVGWASTFLLLTSVLALEARRLMSGLRLRHGIVTKEMSCSFGCFKTRLVVNAAPIS